MRLGCSTILYGGHGIDTALDRIAAAGYAAVELCSIPGMAEHLSPDADASALLGIRRRLNDLGLELESIGASGNLLDDTRRAEFRRLIDHAAALGAPAITTGSGGVSDDSESFQRVLATLSELGAAAHVAGVVISIKPHVRQAVYDTATALQLASTVDPMAIGLNFDASHLVRAGEDPIDSLARLGPHVATARIRDAVRGVDGPGPVERQVPGEGDLEVGALARAIATLSRPRYAVLEIVGTRDWPVDRIDPIVARSRDRLSTYFQ